jgi:deazaflavin-dependent oxidoreductase (nitroreductase family)
MKQWKDEDFCYVTTTGRRTGRPHQIEIWFGADGDTIYLLSGGGDRSDWFKNLKIDPSVTVRIGDRKGVAGPESWRIRMRTQGLGGCWPRSTRDGRKANP